MQERGGVIVYLRNLDGTHSNLRVKKYKLEKKLDYFFWLLLLVVRVTQIMIFIYNFNMHVCVGK